MLSGLANPERGRDLPGDLDGASVAGAMTAATACRVCGAEPREGARFCDACGAPIAPPDTWAEYKQVTVLFADVVHSMDIAAAVGPERPAGTC